MRPEQPNGAPSFEQPAVESRPMPTSLNQTLGDPLA